MLLLVRERRGRRLRWDSSGQRRTGYRSLSGGLRSHGTPENRN